jgi:hypothetical protein
MGITYWRLVGNGWELGLLGLLLIVIMDHSRKFPTYQAPVRGSLPNQSSNLMVK